MPAGWPLKVLPSSAIGPDGAEPIVPYGPRMQPATPASVLPRLPEGGWPIESPARKLLIRGVALLALGLTLTYLVWRLDGTIPIAVWWLSIPLFVV